MIFLAMAACLGIGAQDELFKKYSDVKDVQTVYISKALLSMAGKQQIGGVKIGGKGSDIDRVKVISCERKALANKIFNEALNAMRHDKYELVLETKDDDERSYIYLKNHGKKNEFVVINAERSSVYIANILGTLTLGDVNAITDDD